MEIFMTAGFLIFRYPLLRVLQTPEDTFTGTMSYITVILAGIHLTMLCNIKSRILLLYSALANRVCLSPYPVSFLFQ